MGLSLYANNSAVFYAVGYGTKVFSLAWSGKTFTGCSVECSAVGAAQNILTSRIKKPVPKHVERRAGVRAMI